MVNLFTDLVLITTGFLLLLTSAALLSQSSKNNLSRNLLTAFLLTKAFLILRWAFFRYGFFEYSEDIYLYSVSMSVFFLLAPLLYLYIKSICYKSFAFSPVLAVHIAPFILFIVYTILDVYSYKTGVGFLCVPLFDNHSNDIFWGANFVQILIYIFLILRLITNYRTDLLNRCSTLEKIDLRWVYFLTLLLFLHWLFVVSRGTLSLLGYASAEAGNLMDLFSITIFLIFITFLVFKGLRQLKIDTGIYENGKSKGAKLPQTVTETLAREIMNHMNTRRPFLKPSLTIDDLSEELSVPQWKLSQAINDFYKQNFFNFVNSFRIEEAKKLLSEQGNGNKTILEILYEAGFNSKSTFNYVFKIHTGMTPSEFKNQPSTKSKGV